MMMVLDETIDRYATAWGEPGPDERLKILDSVLMSDATYTDPQVHTANAQELSDHIGRVLREWPGARVIRTSAVDQHHGKARFAWRLETSDGKALPEGLDIIEIDAGSGRIRSILGFFGPLRRLA